MKRYFNNSSLRFLLTALTILILTGGVGLTKATGQTLDPKFQSVFIYGVARKIEWKSTGSTFKIAVVGSDKLLVSELKKLAASKTLNDKQVVVEEVSSGSGTFNQDIVFMAGSDKALLKQLLSKASPTTLVMSAYPSGLADGSHLNFILDGNKITFELNKSGISNTSLKISDDLIGLASVVK